MTKTYLSTIEKLFIKTGKIIAVRYWKGGNLYEIDVYLPDVDFSNWNKTQSIKCRTSSLHTTDYSPALWNAGEKSCTLYIDTSHNGYGSIWAKNQIPGSDFHYLKIEAEKHFPIAGKHLFFLGDQTAIGHFCALQQLAVAGTMTKGYIVFNDVQTTNAFAENCPWLPLQSVSTYETMHSHLEKWLVQHPSEKNDFVFYVVGNAKLIVSLRKLLKKYNINSSQIKSKGFWH